jgi:hypothetical protein
MTTIVSNLYATNAFSEHPIALWAIDDDVSFLSLINESDRSFINWGEFTNAVASSALPISGAPFEDDIFSKITIVSASSGPGEAISTTVFNPSELSQYQENFAISFFIYTNCTDVDYYEFGYRYFDDFAGQYVEEVLEVQDRRFNTWIRMSGTFNPPDDSTVAQLIFRAYANDGSVNYDFIMNGLAVGQWSETTSYLSLGSQSASTPLGYDGIPALEYGIQENSGYYLVENKRLLGINEGLPLVFGAQNSTKIIPSASANPSVIFPGYGFLYESGKYKNYTIEFWMRVNPDTIESRRIFGPLDTDNGVYVRDGVISLVIGDSIGSHPVGEWYRPMLVHIVLRDDTASMMINGEQVFTIDIDINNIEFAQTNDWIGFYSYSDISQFEIDCVSIYSYPMSIEAAKRRFVWGQGTESPQTVSDAFSGRNAYINFSNAGYTVNKTYPDSNLWGAGYYDNLSVTRTSISSPDYSLPEIVIGEKTLSELYEDNKIVNELENENFFTFRPHISASTYVTEGTKWTEPSYMLFESLGFIERLESVYGTFSVKDFSGYHPLMTFQNNETDDTLEIYLEDGFICYQFNDDLLSEQEMDYATDPYGHYEYGYNYGSYNPMPIDEYHFAVGINIKSFINEFGYQVNRFFKSINSVQLYVGGTGETTFEGKIYAIGFTNRKNNVNVEDLFLPNGIIDYFEYDFFTNYYATYSLVPLIRYNRYFLDISVAAQWEEYFPLSTFAGYIKDYDGENFYDLDYLQINLGYPSVTELVAEVVENLGWSYEELRLEYSVPVQKSYEALDNAVITGYQNYNDLKQNNFIEYFLHTEKSGLRAYITFQSLFDGANKPISEFPYTKDVASDYYIDASKENGISEPYRAYQTVFEFVDNVVVYPPKNIDFTEIAMVVHLDIKQKGILSSPIRVRDLEIASRALNKNSVTAIKTESGIPLYPYVKTGFYLDYKQQNPILISKNRFPYLHLTSHSGIQVLGDYDNEREYGIAMPINEEKRSTLRIGSVQLWAKYDFLEFSAVPYEIFDIQSRTRNIEFVITADSSGRRGIISARDKTTKIVEERLTYYQNGIPVKNPIIEIGQWNAIGIEFDDPLEFNNYVGYLNLYRGMVYNNIAYYDAAGLGERVATSSRIWLRVLTLDGSGNYTWAYWLVDPVTSMNRTWKNISTIEEKIVFDLSQQDVYNSFVGTNRIIVDDGTSLNIDADQLTIISDTSWTRFSGIPA